MKFGILAFVLAALCSFTLRAEDKFPDIGHKDLVEAIKTNKVVLIDCNGTDSYTQQHIPGAINFAADKAALATKLPADKAALIVAYCGNENCNAYQNGAKAVEALGYTNVKHYSKGIAGWVKEKETVEGAKAAATK